MKFLSRAGFLISVDLASVYLLLLFSSYYGVSHIYLLLSGALFLSLSIYDCRTGRISEIFISLVSLPGTVVKRHLNWLPVLLSAILISHSLALLMEYGLVNEVQRIMMQQGMFPQFALRSTAVTGAIIATAVFTATSKRERG